MFWKGSSAGVIFSPKNRITPLSNFVARRSKDSRFSLYLLFENPSKRCGASCRRKLKSHSIPAAGMRKPSCWLPLFDWMSLNNKRLPSLLSISYYSTIWLTTSNQKIGNQQDGLWLARTCINLAMHPCHSILWDSNFLLPLALGCLGGFSIRRYEGESFDLLATKFESGVMRFLAN